MKIKMNKKILIISIIVFLIVFAIFIYFFIGNDNKNLKLGNNLSNKTLEEIEKYILNISSYEAQLEVKVESNKNRNKYILKQEYVSPNIEKQVVIEPKNIEGLEIIYDGNKLIINNSKLNTSTIYNEYKYISDNFLWLNSFIEDYKSAKEDEKNTKIYEENNMVILEVKMDNKNPYIGSKRLIIDKENGNIKEMIIQDENKKELVYILYNEIKINSMKKEEVLAFHLQEYKVEQY